MQVLQSPSILGIPYCLMYIFSVYTKLQFFNSDTGFSGTVKEALQDCFGCIIWKVVPFMVDDYIFTNGME